MGKQAMRKRKLETKNMAVVEESTGKSEYKSEGKVRIATRLSKGINFADGEVFRSVISPSGKSVSVMDKGVHKRALRAASKVKLKVS